MLVDGEIVDEEYSAEVEFTVGSTRNAVLRAHGTPTSISRNELAGEERWSYYWGVRAKPKYAWQRNDRDPRPRAEVIFDLKSGKVIEWDNSSGMLRAR
jgi:hypothetical protein